MLKIASVFLCHFFLGYPGLLGDSEVGGGVKKRSQKKNQILMKIKEMMDVFINSGNFVPNEFLTLAPPSGYALSLKALIKV